MSLRLPARETDPPEQPPATESSDWSSWLRICEQTVSWDPLTETVANVAQQLAAAQIRPTEHERDHDDVLVQADDVALPATFGRYEVRQLLDAGGQATVYRAWDPVLQREVAIKVAHVNQENLLLDGSRLCEEGALLAQVQHPSLSQVYDCGTAGGHPYLVMELVAGCTLQQHAQSCRMSAREICRMVTEVADALDAAHAQRVLHLDLKPDNVMVTANGRCRLIDFGMGALLSTLARYPWQMQAGTPEYMSPEQQRGEVRGWSTATDVFGLGGLLAFLLSGQAPFPQPEMEESRRWQRLQDLKDQLRRGPHRALAAVACRALAYEPGDRYRNAAAMAKALRVAGRTKRTGTLCLTAGLLAICAGLLSTWPETGVGGPGGAATAELPPAVAGRVNLEIVTSTANTPLVAVWSPSLGFITLSGLESELHGDEFRWFSRRSGEPVAFYCPDVICLAICCEPAADTDRLTVLFQQHLGQNFKLAAARANAVQDLFQADLLLSPVAHITGQADLHSLAHCLRSIPHVFSASLIQFDKPAETIEVRLSPRRPACAEDPIFARPCPNSLEHGNEAPGGC